MDNPIRRLRGTTGAIALALSFALLFGLGQGGASAAPSSRPEMRRLTNGSRLSHHRLGLKLNARLSRLALRHSREMARAGELFHSDNIPRALRPYRWSAWGENVGFTSQSLPVLERMFMHSRPHKENILNRRFAKVGVGVVHRRGVYWVTLIFYG